MSGMARPRRFTFTAADGAGLAWHELGEGRPVVLLHGLFSDADTNWIRFGHAAEIASRGHRVIMPDLRAHGTSARPHDAASYPPDVLADDGLALIGHLGLTDYDLGGYSLGARTAVRMVAKGARPKRLVISGMGLDGLHRHRPARGAFQGDPEGARHARARLAGMDGRGVPEDHRRRPRGAAAFARQLRRHQRRRCCAAFPCRRSSCPAPTTMTTARAKRLPRLLPRGEFVEVPGNHMSAVTRPELGRALADFLDR